MGKILEEMYRIAIEAWPAEVIMIVLWHRVEHYARARDETRAREKEETKRRIAAAREVLEVERVRRWARQLADHKHN